MSTRFATTLSLLLAVIAVGSGASSAFFYLRDYHSNTRFKVTGAEKNVLYLAVWNTGNKPSTLIHSQLSFGKLDINPIELDLTRDDRQAARSVISSGKPVKLGLWLPHELVLTRKNGDKYQKTEIKTLLDQNKTAKLRLDIDVEESNDPSPGRFFNLCPPRQAHHRFDEFAVDRASEFVLASMSDVRGQ